MSTLPNTRQIDDRKRLGYDYSLSDIFQLADSELWEDLIRVAKDISQSPDKDHQQLLKQNFICGKKWPSKQVNLRHQDWHQVPHVGDTHC